MTAAQAWLIKALETSNYIRPKTGEQVEACQSLKMALYLSSEPESPIRRYGSVTYHPKTRGIWVPDIGTLDAIVRLKYGRA